MAAREIFNLLTCPGGPPLKTLGFIALAIKSVRWRQGNRGGFVTVSIGCPDNADLSSVRRPEAEAPHAPDQSLDRFTWTKSLGQNHLDKITRTKSLGQITWIDSLGATRR
jgi:hypothetical protein